MVKGILNKYGVDNYGVSLGIDPLSPDHNKGISHIREAFGIPAINLQTGIKPEFGVPARKISKNKAFFYPGEKCLLGYTSGNPYYYSLLDVKIPTGPNTFNGFWDARGFCIVSDQFAAMHNLWQAFVNLDIIIYTGKGLENGGGLNIYVAATFKDATTMLQQDLDAYQLGLHMKNSKIESRLRAAGIKNDIFPVWSNLEKQK